MANDNHKTTPQDNIQRDATPSVLLQMDTRSKSTQHHHPGRLQRKPGWGIGVPEGEPPGLCLRVPVPHWDSQPIFHIG